MKFGLKGKYKNKDFGIYAGEDNKLNVCFISNNDITGGNSGSPVINSKGHLIGCAFDGNWEAMSGDIAFEHELQRTISVDARYIVFIIDKFAEASNIIDELTLVYNNTSNSGVLPTYREVWMSNKNGVQNKYKTKREFIVDAKSWWKKNKN